MAYEHVDDLLADLKDISRPNLFRIEISDGPVASVIPLMAIKIDIPSTTLSEMTIKRMGRQISWPGDGVEWPEVIASFYDDVDGDLRNRFHQWQQEAYVRPDAESDVIFNSGPEAFYLKVNIKIQQLNRQRQPIGDTTLYRAWPKAIGQISLDYGTEDSLNMFDVTFAYSYATYTARTV